MLLPTRAFRFFKAPAIARSAAVTAVVAGWVCSLQAMPSALLQSADLTVPAEGDAAQAASRGQVESAPPPERSRWLLRSDVSAGAARWSASRGPLDLGLALEREDVPGASTAGAAFRERFATAGDAMPMPSINVGLRRSRGDAASTTAASLLERATQADGRASSYASKLGVEWKPAGSRVSVLREGLGMRLQGNDRMTLRLRHGRLKVYLFRAF